MKRRNELAELRQAFKISQSQLINL